jgi:hypothetical protein
MFIRKRRYKRTPNGCYRRRFWHDEAYNRPLAAEESEYAQICESYRDEQLHPRRPVTIAAARAGTPTVGKARAADAGDESQGPSVDVAKADTGDRAA